MPLHGIQAHDAASQLTETTMVEPGAEDDFRSNQIDEEEALRRIGGDREVLSDVIGAFLDSYAESMDDIRSALDAGGAPLAFAVHRFKGALAQLAAHPALTAAMNLEEAATGRRAETVALFHVLQAEVALLVPALRGLAARLT